MTDLLESETVPAPEPTAASVRLLKTTKGCFLLYRGPQAVVRYFLNLPGARTYDAGTALALPLTRDNLCVLEVLGQLEEPDEEYAAAARELLWPSQEALALYPPPVEGAPVPRWHQRAAFGWCLDALIAGRRGFLNGCTLGSGKTRMAIDLMRHLVRTRALVIGQKTTLEQWAEELARAWPEAQPHVLHQVGKGTMPERAGHLYELRLTAFPDGPQVILVNWESLQHLEKDLKKFGKFDVIVADEASRLLGRTTKMARAAKQLAWKHAWYTIAMTGTPIRRSVEDLLALFQFVDSNVYGSTIKDFREQFCDETFNPGQGIGYIPKPTQVPELIRRFYSAGFRVSRAAVELPEPERRTVVLQPSAEQKERLKRIKVDADAEGANVLARQIAEQQTTAGFMHLPPSRFDLGPGLEGEGPTTYYLDNPKLDWIVSYLSDLLPNEDAHVIVWTKFIPEIEAVHKRLADLFPQQVARIDGSVQDAARQIIRRWFNDRAHPVRVLVMNLQTGSMGLDLPAADISIYHSNTFNYVDRTQSEGRGTRLGRVKPCQLIDLVLAGTIDEQIQENLATKGATEALLVGKGVMRAVPKDNEHNNNTNQPSPKPAV